MQFFCEEGRISRPIHWGLKLLFYATHKYAITTTLLSTAVQQGVYTLAI